MKTEASLLTKSLLTLGVVGITALTTYGAITNGGMLNSTPYQSRSSTADATLSRLTNGSGAIILDGVIAKVATKASEKGGSPVNVTAYNAYIDTYLRGVDELDNTTRSQLGSDYAFIFQYIYPRVYEMRKQDTAFESISNKLTEMVGSSAVSTTATNTSASTTSASASQATNSQTVAATQATTTQTAATQAVATQTNTVAQTQTTPHWVTRSSGYTLCTQVGGGNVAADSRLSSATCNAGDVVYQRTNCTQGDINDRVKFMWTNYECVGGASQLTDAQVAAQNQTQLANEAQAQAVEAARVQALADARAADEAKRLAQLQTNGGVNYELAKSCGNGAAVLAGESIMAYANRTGNLCDVRLCLAGRVLSTDNRNCIDQTLIGEVNREKIHTANLAAKLSNGVVNMIGLYDERGILLTNVGFSPDLILKGLIKFNINKSQLSELADKLDASGIGYKPYQLYPGTGSDAGIDLRDLASGGLGTAYNWTVDAYCSQKGVGACDKVNENKAFATAQGLVANPNVTTGGKIDCSTLAQQYSSSAGLMKWAICGGGTASWYATQEQAIAAQKTYGGTVMQLTKPPVQ